MTAPVIRDYLKVVASDVAGATDADLVARFARSRDEAAFELLVWRHAALVQRVCSSVLRDRHAAEDAAQATFLVLARKASSFAGRGAVVGWLYRVARRVSLRHARQRSRLRLGSEGLDRVPAPEGDPFGADSADAVCEEVARLPERYRVPVLLCFFEGLTYADAARRTGWPIGTVSSRLTSAKTLLARRLARRGLGVPAIALPLAGGAFVSQTAQAATAFVAPGGRAAKSIPPTVLSLATGETMKPLFAKLSATAALLCAVTAGAWGLAPYGQLPPLGGGGQPGDPHPGGPPPTAADAAPGPVASTAAQRAISFNNLKQIVLAFHSHYDQSNAFPEDVTDNTGRPLLSWRVRILPYIEQGALYKQFKLDEPWDSEHNKKLLSKMPEVFRVPTAPKGTTTTYYQGLVGPGTVFEPGVRVTPLSIPDGMSNTVALVEAGPPAEWTKPGGIAYDPKKPLPKLAGPYTNALMAGLADGRPVAFKPDVKADLLRKFIERADGSIVDIDAATVGQFPPGKEEAVAELIARDNAALAAEVRRLQAEREKLAAGGAVAKPAVSGIEKLARENEELKRQVEALRQEIEQLKKASPTKP